MLASAMDHAGRTPILGVVAGDNTVIMIAGIRLVAPRLRGRCSPGMAKHQSCPARADLVGDQHEESMS
jgi:hypothetical protein